MPFDRPGRPTLGGVLQFRQACGTSEAATGSHPHTHQLSRSQLAEAAASHQWYLQVAALRHSISPQRQEQHGSSGRRRSQHAEHSGRHAAKHRHSPHRPWVPHQPAGAGRGPAGRGAAWELDQSAAAAARDTSGPQTQSLQSLFSDLAAEASGQTPAGLQESSRDLCGSSSWEDHSGSPAAASRHGPQQMRQYPSDRQPRVPGRAQRRHHASPDLLAMVAQLGQAIQQGTDR